jgi:hypothetical protein
MKPRAKVTLDVADLLKTLKAGNAKLGSPTSPETAPPPPAESGWPIPASPTAPPAQPEGDYPVPSGGIGGVPKGKDEELKEELV